MSNPPAYSKNSDTKFSYPTPSPVSYSVPYSQPPASPTLDYPGNYQPQNGGYQPQNGGYQPQNAGYQPQNAGFQPQNGDQMGKIGFNPHMMPIRSASELSEISESTFTTCPNCNYSGFSNVERKTNYWLVILVVILLFSRTMFLALLGIALLLCVESRHHVCAKCNKSMASKFSCCF